MEGSKAAIAALRPVLEERDAGPGRTSSTSSSPPWRPRWASTAVGDGWKLHNELSEAELKELSDVINALGEPISKVAAVVSPS